MPTCWRFLNLNSTVRFGPNFLLTIVGCVCHKVRIKAQRVLSSCIEVFDYFARTLIPTTLSKLQNSPDISHEEFKVGTSMRKYYCGR